MTIALLDLVKQIKQSYEDEIYTGRCAVMIECNLETSGMVKAARKADFLESTIPGTNNPFELRDNVAVFAGNQNYVDHIDPKLFNREFSNGNRADYTEYLRNFRPMQLSI